MHPYSRPSPRTASPASNLQTNPTRTNNQRHNSQDMTAYSTTPPYSDRGAEESEGEMMSRGEPASESRGQYHKVNQVIQVLIFSSRLWLDAYLLPPELLHQISPRHRIFSRNSPPSIQQGWQDEAQQMGMCCLSRNSIFLTNRP